MNSPFELSGRRVLVTGGSQGIGAAAVTALHAAGAHVLFTYRSSADLAQALCTALGPRCMTERLDLTDTAALPAIAQTCFERLGGIDVLVNNAGIFAENPFDGDDLDAWRHGWQRTFAVNVFAAADLAWLAIRAMRRAGTRGAIINVASRAAHRGELTFADYGASKAALVNLTKSIARSCARDGITAFAVAPGFIATEMAAAALASDGAAIAAEIPSGRVGTPDDVGAIIAFLASPRAAYATGTTIDVNGASYVR
jgi:NAD(P)-dependent dehydrogenase (short-subunit alcohol dehydrogenase family)